MVVSTSPMTASPEGPRIMPANRKPSTGERPITPIAGVTRAAANSSTIVSRSAAEMCDRISSHALFKRESVPPRAEDSDRSGALAIVASRSGARSLRKR